MTEITINISNSADASFIRKFLEKFDSVTFVSTRRKRKTGIDEALEDVKAGRVYHAKDVDDLFKQLDS